MFSKTPYWKQQENTEKYLDPSSVMERHQNIEAFSALVIKHKEREVDLPILQTGQLIHGKAKMD